MYTVDELRVLMALHSVILSSIMCFVTDIIPAIELSWVEGHM